VVVLVMEGRGRPKACVLRTVLTPGKPADALEPPLGVDQAPPAVGLRGCLPIRHFRLDGWPVVEEKNDSLLYKCGLQKGQ